MKLCKLNVSLALATMLFLQTPGTLAAAAAEERECAGGPVMEIVVFSAGKDVSDGAMMRAASDVLPELKGMPGFMDRAFAKSSGGKWIDVVRWKDMASAQAAADAMTKDEKAAAFFALIDVNDMQIKHVCE